MRRSEKEIIIREGEGGISKMNKRKKRSGGDLMMITSEKELLILHFWDEPRLPFILWLAITYISFFESDKSWLNLFSAVHHKKRSTSSLAPHWLFTIYYKWSDSSWCSILWLGNPGKNGCDATSVYQSLHQGLWENKKKCDVWRPQLRVLKKNQKNTLYHLKSSSDVWTKGWCSLFSWRFWYRLL